MNYRTFIPDSWLNFIQRKKRERELLHDSFEKEQLKNLNKVRQNWSEPILFAGYPKSGNTWLRFLLYHYLELIKSNLDSPLKYSELNSLQNDSLEGDVIKNGGNFPEIVRTHLYFHPEFLDVFRKFIYIYRNPLDVLVSAYHFFVINRKGPTKYSPNNNIDNYVKYNLVNWVHHYISYKTSGGFSTSYEELKNDAHQELRSLLNYLNIDVDINLVEKAVALSDFQAIKKMTIKSGETHGSGPKGIQKGVFTRKGQIGGYKDELSDATIMFARKYLKSKGLSHLYSF